MKRLVICFIMALWTICLFADVLNPYNVALIINLPEYDFVTRDLQYTFESKGFKVYVGTEWGDVPKEERWRAIVVETKFELHYGYPSVVTVTVKNPSNKKLIAYRKEGMSFTEEGDIRKAMRKIVKAIEDTPYEYEEAQTIQPSFPRIEMNEDSVMHYLQSHKTEDIEGVYKITGTGFSFTKIAVIRQDERICLFYLQDNSPFQQGDIIAYLELVENNLYIATYIMEDKSIREGLAQYNDFSLRIGLRTNKDGKEEMDILAIKLKIKGINTQKNPSSTDNGTMVATGSGFFVSDRIIATNYHVVENADSVKIRVKGKSEIVSYYAKVLITDKTNDLALVSITDRKFAGVQAIPYKFYLDTKDVGTSIFTMGYPLSQILGTEIKITDGIISSKTGFEGDIVTYQITAPIQPGNSGGALFDKNGVLVGITNAVVPSAENVGYAIKTIYLKNLIESAPVYIEIPQGKDLTGKDLTELVKILSPYVVFVEIY